MTYIDNTKPNINVDSQQNERIITQKVERQSGLELLRIIAMIIIILYHFVIYSKIDLYSAELVFSSKILRNGGKLGVNIFILISAYFMVNKKFKWTRILNIVIQTFFYSILFYLIFLSLGRAEFNISSILSVFMPISYTEYTFVTLYVMLMFLSPLLNLLIKKIGKKMHGIICIVLSCVIVLFPYFNMIVLGRASEFPFVNTLVWFVVLYLIAGYIRLYVKSVSQNQKVWLYLLLVVFVTLQMVYTIYIDFRESCYEQAIGNTVISIILLLIFKDFKFKNRFINTVASTTFGIFLIHENPYIRGWWWNFLVNTFSNFIKNYVLLALTLTLITFILFSIIDYIRLKTIHRLTQNLLNKIDKKIETHSNISNKQKE